MFRKGSFDKNKEAPLGNENSRTLAIKYHKDWLKSIGAEGTSLKALEKYHQASIIMPRLIKTLWIINHWLSVARLTLH